MEIFPHFTVFVFAIIVFYVSYKAFVFWTFCKWSVLSERFVNFIVLHYASSMLILTSKSSIFLIYFTSHMILSSLRKYMWCADETYLICVLLEGCVHEVYMCINNCYYILLCKIQLE